MTRVLTVPGWQGSAPKHWQSQWERLDARVTRVEQPDWEAPSLSQWRARLRDALEPQEPTVLAAHSLGCLLIAHAAKELPGVVGALLVAPPDLEGPGLPEGITGFGPVPLDPLPFPSTVVASRDDAFCTFERAQRYAAAWGSQLVDVGARGHLNTASGLGTWPMGRALLRALQAHAPFALDPRLAADTTVVGQSPLSLLLMMNDARYPWFILVPQRSAVTEVFELEHADQRQLAQESALLAQAVSEAFQVDKVNVGALGNVVRQLHVHHVGRWLGDPAWPGPVWGHSGRVERDVEAQHAAAAALFRSAALAQRFSRAL